MQAYVLKTTAAHEIPSIEPVDWEDGQPTLAWLREHRRALLAALFREGATLKASDAELHSSRVHELARLDDVIDELERAEAAAERASLIALQPCPDCGALMLCDCASWWPNVA